MMLCCGLKHVASQCRATYTNTYFVIYVRSRCAFINIYLNYELSFCFLLATTLAFLYNKLALRSAANHNTTRFSPFFSIA